MKTIVWFRQDLRIADHPALHAASESGDEVLPVFIYAPEEEGAWPLGGASKVWLHDSLSALAQRLQAIGSQLIIRQGPALEVLLELVAETGAEQVLWTRRYEPASIARDTAVKAGLVKQGIEAHSYNGALLFEPWKVETKAGGPYKVFTPYWNMIQTLPPPREPLPEPDKLKSPEAWPTSLAIEDLKLLPSLSWNEGIQQSWTPGEAGALAELDHFLDQSLSEYPDGRDRPAVKGTSHMSPYLHFGEISPNTVWYSIQEHAESHGGGGSIAAADAYLRQIAWRDFAHHLLYHFPQTPDAPLKEAYAAFPWNERKGHLAAWQQGMTGYPIVDAGLRELWHTGWMHNRVRMIVASFLIKDLLIDWRKGAAWFWDTLVDADLANNTMGWQWTAGCGADASPFFRVFNPMSQGEKFDPRGAYARKWCPELAELPDKYIYRPFEAPQDVLDAAGVVLGKNYPKPLVDHKVAREKALEALAVIKAR